MRALEYVNWNYTYRCNFECAHCYSRADSYPKELDTNAYRWLADEIIRAQAFGVGFGGGEPLVRKDCISNISRLSHAGLETHLTTNGWFLSEELIERLAQAELSMLIVSIDSVYADRHDQIRRAGSFERALASARRSAKLGLNTYFSFVITKKNISEIDAVAQLATSEGLAGVSFKFFRPAGNGFINRALFELSASDRNSAGCALSEAQNRYGIDLRYFQDAQSGCSCGVTQLTLRPNGDLLACPYSDYPIANAFERPITQTWQSLQSAPPMEGCTATNGILAPMVPRVADSDVYVAGA